MSHDLLTALKEAEQETMDLTCARDLFIIIDKIENGEKLDEDDDYIIADYYDSGSRDK